MNSCTNSLLRERTGRDGLPLASRKPETEAFEVIFMQLEISAAEDFDAVSLTTCAEFPNVNSFSLSSSSEKSFFFKFRKG